MSDYTKAVNFATKDALASGNPLKTINGTEFNVEFDAIAVASATKANLAAPTFTGIPAAPTAAAATNTTQLATTAFVTTAVANTDLTSLVVKANNLSDLTNASTARTNLGLAIGTDVQAYDATYVVDADIGVNVQAYDATIVVDADIGTTVQAYDADTSKTDVAETRSASINMADNIVQRPVLKDYGETKVAVAAHDVDLALGNVQTYTLVGNQTLTFSNPPATGTAGAFTLIGTNLGVAVITWPTSVDWAAATAPTLTAAGVDVLTFVTVDGGTIWYGVVSGLGMA